MAEQVIAQTNHFIVLYDIDPVQTGHLLIISKAHRMSLDDFNEQERLELIQLQSTLIQTMMENLSIEGVTLLQNSGQIMMEGTHYHAHLVPRYLGDGFYDNQVVKAHALDKSSLSHHVKQALENHEE